MTFGKYPHTRMRRSRMKPFARELKRESTLTPKDLIFPLFVTESGVAETPIASMPGVFRYNLDHAVIKAKEAFDLGIPAVALFPVVLAEKKSLDAAEAWNPDGIVPKAIRAIKKACDQLGVITDVALDPYTAHGQDGILDHRGEILNDETVAVLVKQALCHATAGADVVAPSDMMDGRIGQIRSSFEREGFYETLILAYSAKYASSFYGPFRDAIGTKTTLGRGTKHSYQMDPGNSLEAMQEIALDIDEGADLVMVKPGLSYLDIISRAHHQFTTPILAYNVSGEYAMVKAASQQGWIDEREIVLEILLSFKRAGASAVLTYHAMDAALWLK